MELSGRTLSKPIKKQLKIEVAKLKKRGISPKIAIVTLGEEASWEAYVGQKLKLANKLGIEATLINLKNADENNILTEVSKIDKDKTIHGIIIQRPFSQNLNKEKVINSISANKDIDGFRADSKFDVPTWLAVKHFLKIALNVESETNLKKRLSELNVVVLGKGETAGMPAIKGFRKLGFEPKIIDSKTTNREELLKNADVLVSAVGKRVVEPQNLKKGVILIGVGIRRNTDEGKLLGDYNEKEISEVASFHTPTPGGVGPLNLSYLFKNLIYATKIQSP